MSELTLPDGEHTIGEKIFIVKDGKVIEVKDVVKTELAVEYNETKLDSGTPARFEGELTVGTKLEVQKEDGTWVAATEGQHNLEDDRVVYVDAEGKVNEIQTPDTKKVDEVGLAEDVIEEEVKEEEMEEVVTEETSTYSKADLDAKFDELYKMIADLKAEEIIEDVIEEENKIEVALSVNQRFSAISEFLKKK